MNIIDLNWVKTEKWNDCNWTDDCRVERASSTVPPAADHHRAAERFARGARKDSTSATPVRRKLQAHQSAPSAANPPVRPPINNLFRLI